MRKSWSQFEKDIEKLVTMMKKYRPDIIVPSMCGGLVPAGILAEKLGMKDVRPISIERIGEERRIKYDISGNIYGKAILLLEDDLPSGKGFMHAKKVYQKKGAKVKIAAVYVNSKTKYIADFYGECSDPMPDLPWKPSRAGDRIVR